MTPSQLDHLNLIKTHLKALLANAEKRTPGKWESEPQFKNEIWCDSEYICDCIDSAEPNAVFIASCAGNAEAGWRSTLAAIAASQRYIERSQSIGDHCGIECANGVIETILAAWPLESLKL